MPEEPRRANFQTVANVTAAELKNYEDNPVVQTALENGNPMMDIPIESVFAFSRIKRPITWFHFVFFTLWTPIGLVVLVIRCFFMFSFLGFFFFIGGIPSLDFLGVRTYVPFLFCNIIMPVCGLFHSVRGEENKSAVLVDKCIFVSNHISNFDPLWFNCVFRKFTLLCAGDYDWFWEVMKRIGVLTRDDKKGKGCIYTNYFGTQLERDNVRIAIEEDMARDDARPFLIYPEGCVTTGVTAVMQYQQFVFGLDKVVVPMCISLYNPWPYEHYTLSGGAAQHLLWYMFCPFVIMRHAILPPQKCGPNEKPMDFALRVQCMTAAHLGLGVIKMNWKQKDRLAQALGFQPYNEHEWSRRESMDEFKLALFSRQLVIRDGETGRADSGLVGGSQPGGKVKVKNAALAKKSLADEAAFLAKAYATKHADRGVEMQFFDEAMAKAKEEHNRKGSVTNLLNTIIGNEGAGINAKVNEEFVNKINVERRRSSVKAGTSVKELKPFTADQKEREKSVKEKRRNSQAQATDEAAAKATALASGQKWDQKEFDALVLKHGGVPRGNMKIAPAPQEAAPPTKEATTTAAAPKPLVSPATLTPTQQLLQADKNLSPPPGAFNNATLNAKISNRSTKERSTVRERMPPSITEGKELSAPLGTVAGVTHDVEMGLLLNASGSEHESNESK